MRHDRESSCELLLGPRRPLSTPASRIASWIGSALPRVFKPRGFAEFGGIQRAVSMPAAQFSSPLRLPISPSGRGRSVAVPMQRRLIIAAPRDYYPRRLIVAGHDVAILH